LAKYLSIKDEDLPRQLRISIGSAIVLGLLEGRLDAAPTAIYLMTHKVGKCMANCSFCPQAQSSSSKTELLSRVSWPAFPTNEILEKLKNTAELGKISRVCIQALNYSNVLAHLVALVTAIKQHTAIPISVSCQPSSREYIHRLSEVCVERIGIALDAATKELFKEVKGEGVGGPYTWKNQLKRLREAVEIFGKGKVSTHLIIGLGETEDEAVSLIQRCIDMDVYPALFAFTPVRGTALEWKTQPPIESYRRIQLARHLIVNEKSQYEKMRFDSAGCLIDFGVGKEALGWIVETGKMFMTSGCPNCNRPFYNEKPSGPIFNFPREIMQEEIAEIKRQLELQPNY
jgi:biotin synthase